MEGKNEFLSKKPNKIPRKTDLIDRGIIFIFGSLNGQKGRNPRTGEIIHIPKKKRLNFLPAKNLKKQ
ncbi:MAG: HU family DNA-binding protein [Candidatus Aminicenantia bacterium]